MLSSLIYAIQSGGDAGQALIDLLCCLPVILFSLSFHEYAHAWTAHKLGDDTARLSGRMTLNPISHIHPIGFLMMLTVGFGFAKPVPVNPFRFKNSRKGTAIVSLAGPLSNLILALIFTFVSVAFDNTVNSPHVLEAEGFVQTFKNISDRLISLFVSLNVNLAIFNLIPLPPLDGSKILCSFLPLKIELKMRRYERYFMIGLFALILIGVLDVPLSFLSGGVQALFQLIAENALFFL